ncbi:hypothetical protein ACO0RG_004345 [Hanseniaspora osmophila]
MKRFSIGSANALKKHCFKTLFPKTRLSHTSNRFYSTSNIPPPSPPPLASSNTKMFGGFLAGALLASGVVYYQMDSELDVNKDSCTVPLDLAGTPKYCDPKSEQFHMAIVEIQKVLFDETDCWSITPSELDAHSDSYFNTHHPLPDQRPNIVVYPKTTEQVSKIMAICHENYIPVIPCSGMSSLEGHLIPTRHGVSIDFSKFMNKIIQLDKANLDVQVQAGVGWEMLNDYLGDNGLLLGVDPGPNAMIGGMVGTSCSGTKAFRYGTMKENVINLTVVLADGTVIKTRRRPKKSSAGYNLNGLFVGSEGTLGVVTEATIKCHVLPKFESIAMIPFNSIKDATECVTDIVTNGMILNAMELMDNNMMKIINESGQTERHWEEKPTLFFKIGGQDEKDVDHLASKCKEFAEKHNNLTFEFAKDDDEKLELWSARKVALWSTIDTARKNDPESRVWTTDVIVPISNFPRFMEETKKDADDSGLLATMVSHAGEGNSHFFYCYSKKDKPIVEKLVHNMIKRAIALEGSASGEHGCGVGKREYVLEELGEAPIALMRKIKFSLDPHKILNPDKVMKIDMHEPKYD